MVEINTPVEEDIRAHFGKLLSPDTGIEIVPHTKLWATAQGVLLWDPKNGYADPYGAEGDYNPPTFKPDNNRRWTPYPKQGREPIMFETTNEVVKGPALKTVIYLTGPQGSGKTMLVNMMADAVELNRSYFIGFTDLSRNISKQDHHRTVVITTNDLSPQAFNVDNALKIWCRERKIEYLNINLK